MGDKVEVSEKDVETTRLSKRQIDEENERLEKELGGTKMSVMLVDQPDRSINIGVVGVGQAGSKIAENFYNLGYSTVVINTAMQDLKYINVPERQKLFLDVALGGAAKDLETGAAAVEEYADQVLEMLEKNFEDSDVLMLVTSGGGGTGSGSAENMVKIMSQLDKPVVVIYVLGLSTEDALSKHNCFQTLSKLARLAKGDLINSLMIVDNAKIELLYPGKSMAQFWKVANQAIVEPLHLFNELSANPSEYTSLDPMDFSRILVGTSDCALYGMIEVEDYLEEDAIAEAVIANMENGLLASEFDLSQTRSAGVIITGTKEMLDQIPAANLEYGFAMVNKLCNDGTQIFRGVYTTPEQKGLRVYSLFSGLGLPEERVTELKTEAERHMNALQGKEDNRATNMTVDTGKTTAVSAADALHKKIKNKRNAMSKIKKNSKRIIDRRR